MIYRNPVYNSIGTIDIEKNHPVYGWIPFTASPNDVEKHGRKLYAEIISGKYGEIAPYVPEVVFVDINTINESAPNES